ncbi:hypothetical protein [Thermobacillus sp. ZCTH02-B1]|uniref:hypothetical protein n=1 Tax=Thermobacillus sp. ZCTH02-B1 TaxID=1858795 RepID=UPI0025E95039|nr:hypothetical protein [Thermobacillus sp. ZCTH02-B1]
MRHCSVQVRGLLTRDELERYNALMEVGSFLESQGRYDLAYVVQREVDLLIQPAIERLKAKSRERDRLTAEYLAAKRAGAANAPGDEGAGVPSPDAGAGEAGEGHEA